MPLIPLITTALTWLGRIGLAAFAANEIKKFTSDNKEYLEKSVESARAAGFSDEEQRKIVAATTYEQVEKRGEDPEDFWAGLSDGEKKALQFSPTTLKNDMERTRFLGITSAFLFVGALAAGAFGGVRGIPVLLKTLAKIAEARKANASAAQLLTIIEEGKIAGIAKVWIPGLIAAMASAGGWLTSSMTNNLNDATLWGRIFLGQAADDYEKAREATQSGGSSSDTPKNKTIIRMTEEKKPEQFIGTIFSSKLGSAEQFERKLDDEITSSADLETDIKLNLNRWLATLPARMGYSVVVRKDPVDEFGAKQSGIWATLTTYITHLSGKYSPIDTILLGPVSPKVRLELTRRTKTIENQIEEFVTASSVKQINIPKGSVDVFDTSGDLVGSFDSIDEVLDSGIGKETTETQSGGSSTSGDTETKPKEEEKPKAPAPRPDEKRLKDPGKFGPPPGLRGYSDLPIGDFVPELGVFKNQSVFVDTNGSCLNVRGGASTNSPAFGCAPDNAELRVLGDFERAEGRLWGKVRYDNDRVGFGTGTGWIAWEFVSTGPKISLN